VAPTESLAKVNKEAEVSSESSRAFKDSGDLQGDLYVGNFADEINVKSATTLRIGFQNIGGFPTKIGKLKEDNTRQGIQKWEFDIFGMAETNLDWRVLSELEKLPHRTKEWWEHQHISWANNQTFPPRQARQYGRTALLSINKAAHRVIQKGSDNYNLGRLSWTRYKGKGKHTLRIIVAYRPNPP
jgi:hypothetical protein